MFFGIQFYEFQVHRSIAATMLDYEVHALVERGLRNVLRAQTYVFEYTKIYVVDIG